MNLVEDLRSRGWRQQGKPPCGGILMQQAADRIEQLEAALRYIQAMHKSPTFGWEDVLILTEEALAG